MDWILYSKPAFLAHRVNALGLEFYGHISMWNLGVFEQFIIWLKTNAFGERLASYSLIKDVLLVGTYTRCILANQFLDVLFRNDWQFLSRLQFGERIGWSVHSCGILDQRAYEAANLVITWPCVIDKVQSSIAFWHKELCPSRSVHRTY